MAAFRIQTTGHRRLQDIEEFDCRGRKLHHGQGIRQHSAFPDLHLRIGVLVNTLSRHEDAEKTEMK